MRSYEDVLGAQVGRFALAFLQHVNALEEVDEGHGRLFEEGIDLGGMRVVWSPEHVAWMCQCQ